MPTKVSQRFIIDKIEQYETFPHHPKTMNLDINRKIYYEQFNIEYNDINKKSQIEYDGLKLNLFLDPLTRAEKILNIEIEIEEQRDALEEIKLKKMPIDDEKSIEENYYYYNISYEKNDRIVKDYTFNNQKYKQHIITAGFFANIMYKVCFDPIESNIHCKLLDEQEEFFNIMKSKIPEERQRMFSDGNKTGRKFILFITKIIYNYLDYIHKTKLSDKFETIFDILNEMRSIRYIENQNNKVFITEFIGKQIDICDAFEVKIPEGCAPAQARTTQSSK